MPPLGQGSLLEELEPSTSGGGSPTPGGQVSSPSGGVDRWKWAKIVGSVVAISLCGWIIARQVAGGGDPRGETNQRVVIDAETGEVLKTYRIRENDGAPYANPNTGRRTLFPAEMCFWTRDGKAKLTPTYVLLAEYAGRKGPTVCPDCGRNVVARNPAPPMQLMSDAAQRESGRKE